MTLQATSVDVVLSGHGSLKIGGRETKVPEGVRLVILSPPGASITDNLGGALERGEKIGQLETVSPKTGDRAPFEPTIYEPGSRVPDYTLSEPRGPNIEIQPGVPHLLGVEGGTLLSSLWDRVKIFIKPGQTIQCFWAACTAIEGASNPVVDFAAS